MRVLWFEVTVPSSYVNGGLPIGGWQESLERVMRTIPELELIIAFVSEEDTEVKVIDGVTYVPIFVKWSLRERLFCRYWDQYLKKMLPGAIQIVEDYHPDLIHVFGTEWPFGQIASYTKVPVVIHIQGAIVPYNNAGYPPGYSFYDEMISHVFSPMKLFSISKTRRDRINWEDQERRTWNLVNNYMGRTNWDKALSAVMHPNRCYYHVDEALRVEFLNASQTWQDCQDRPLRLMSIGCTTFWKGPDMLLKVASILKQLNVAFEWNVAGQMDPDVKMLVEKKCGLTFKECHVNILGFVNADRLSALLCSSSMYVHTAYIENSPNSVCEAQCLGVPVVATYVGGVSSLITHNEDGFLVPANDPWQMAYAIITLSEDHERMKRYSENARTRALSRHSDEHIRTQIMQCYHSLIS